MPTDTEVERAEAGCRRHPVTGWKRPAFLAVMLSGPPLMSLTFSTIAPVLPSIAEHFGREIDGTLVAQLIMTMPAIGLMLGGPAGGLLIDRLGARRLILFGFAVFAVAGSAGLYLDHAIPLLVSRFLLGFAGVSIATAATWLIGERYDEDRRRRLIGIQDSLAGIAAMSAVLLSGAAAATGGWRMPFAIYLIAAPLFVLALVAVPAIAISGRKDNAAALSVLQPLWPIYASILALAGLMMLPATQVPFLLENIGIADPVIRSRVIASSALLSIVSAALYAPVRQQLGERGTLVVILAAYTLGTTTLAMANNAYIAALGCASLGIGTGLFSPHFASLLIARTPLAVRGRAIGLMFGTIFLSEFLSPLIILPLRYLFGVHGGFLALGGALTCVMLVMALRRSRAA